MIRLASRGLVAGPLILLAACGDGPLSPPAPGTVTITFNASWVGLIFEEPAESGEMLRAGETFALVATVSDTSRGGPLRHEPVAFERLAGDAELRDAEGRTDGQGRARATVVAGSSPGPVRVRLTTTRTGDHGLALLRVYDPARFGPRYHGCTGFGTRILPVAGTWDFAVAPDGARRDW